MAESTTQTEFAQLPIRFFDTTDSDSLLGIDQPDFDFRLITGLDDLQLPEQQTHFGFVCQGQAELDVENRTYPLCQGMYFTAVRNAKLKVDGSVLSVSQKEYLGRMALLAGVQGLTSCSLLEFGDGL